MASSLMNNFIQRLLLISFREDAGPPLRSSEVAVTPMPPNNQTKSSCQPEGLNNYEERGYQ